MATIAFDYTHGVPSGQFIDAAGVFPYRQFVAVDSTYAIDVTGTQFQLDCYIAGSTGTSYVEYSTDGGSTWTDFTPVGSGNFNVEITLTVYTGFSDITRSLLIRPKVAAVFYLNRGGSGCFIVTGAVPNAAPTASYQGNQYIPHNVGVDAIGRPGILNNSRLESGFATITTANNYQCIQPATLFSDVGTGTGGVGAQLRFFATATDIWILTYLDGSIWQLFVDGVSQPTVTAATTNHVGWVHLASGLDGTTQHLYGVAVTKYTVANITQGSGMIHTVRTQGGIGVNTTSQPTRRRRLFLYGDSITANLNIQGDASFSWPYMLGNALNMEFCNSGATSTTVHDFTANPGTLSGAALTSATAYSGEFRVADATGLSPPLDIMVIEYGTNDLGQAWAPSGAPAETQSDFLVSYTHMLNQLVTSLPTTPIYCLGILPRSSITPTVVGQWNSQIQSAIAAVMSANVRYVDPSGWGISTSTDLIDGVHPNQSGAVKIKTNLLSLLGGGRVGRRRHGSRTAA
jgi:lysophospholipase L1-like esterase